MKRYFSFPPHITSASALPGEMKKDKNSIILLKCCTDVVKNWMISLEQSFTAHIPFLMIKIKNSIMFNDPISRKTCVS